MSRNRILLAILVVVAAALAWWIHSANAGPPEVSVAPVVRQTLVSSLTTNGKVEPSQWVAVRAERPGIVERVTVQKGQEVRKGELLAELDSQDAQADVRSAEAAVSQAKADLSMVRQGGKTVEQVEIESAIERDRMDLKNAQREYDSLRRLAEKQAATQQEVVEASQRIQKLQTDMAALERKRGALVGTADRAAAEARLQQAEATLEQARSRFERGHIHSPIAGIVFELPVKDGMYLNVGDLAANVGNLKTLRVRIYVDEPELGRVAEGMAVIVTWDALPGRQWKGSVEKMPTQIVSLGSRQVGEVLCTIENPDLKLLPGTNVNVEITSQVVENALTIPKEAIRNENGQVGVYLLKGGRAEWRPVRLGASSITRAVVLSGLSEGDRVALRSERPLRSGEKIRAQSE